MLTYSFENISKESMYEYLYKCIKQDILSGNIAPDEKLPSKRSFAGNLGVSVITVENAYAQLMAEGYIRSVPKSGYYAEHVAEHLLTPAKADEGTSSGHTEVKKTDRTDHSGRKMALSEGNTGPGSPAEKGTPDFDLVNGRTDPRQFPFTTWAKLMRELLSERQEELMTNAPGTGITELRRAVAKYLMEYQGMNVDEQQIIIGAGTEYLYGLLIQLLGQDKIYALENPGYTKIARVYASHLVETIYLSMDQAGICMRELRESRADILHVSPSHQYPTGITTPIGRRYELLAWANENDNRYIIEDDYDCEFRLAGRPIPSLQSIDREGKVIYMNTFTRSLTSTIRISYMVLPFPLLQIYRKKLGFYSCTVPNFEQYTLAEFIDQGYFGKHINRVRNYYRSKRDELLSCLRSSRLSLRCEILAADAGLHFLMKLYTELSDAELKQRAGEAGIRISCLSDYFSGGGDEALLSGDYRGIAVINYSGLSADAYPLLVERMEKAWISAR